MASEILAVPEEYLSEVIEILRRGMKGSKNSKVKRKLTQWCNEEEEYLKICKSEEI